VVGGLINGLAIATPILVGIAMSEPVAGATACLGAYVAAFTNKGGPRWSRTTGLLVTAGLNTVAFGVGQLTATRWPLVLLILAALVFVAAMGDTFGATAARCGTMPATALLAGMAGTGAANPVTAVMLVATGGLWYALTTMVLTPTPRLRQICATIGQLYHDIAQLIAEPSIREAPQRHSAAVAAVRRAEQAVSVLASPQGDEACAAHAHTLVTTATQLIDALAALDTLDPPDSAVVREYAAARRTLRVRIEAIAGSLTHGRTKGSNLSEADTAVSRTALSEFEKVCLQLRVGAGSDVAAYRRSADTAQYRRRIVSISHDVDIAADEAIALRVHSNSPVTPVAKPSAAHRLRIREACTLGSSTYRHALRATTIVAMLFSGISILALPHGEWAVLAVLRVLRPQYGATTERVWQRVIGNVIGGSCVAVVIASTQSATVLAALLFGVVTVGFALRPVNYGFWVIFGTPLILLIGDLGTPGDWRAALMRIAMTILGSAVALIGSVIILPRWDTDRLPRLLDEARSATADYLDTVLAYVIDPADDGNVQTQRAIAENSLNVATETLHRARREPRHALNRNAANALETLQALNIQLCALTVTPAPTSPQIPYLHSYLYLNSYRQYAAEALHAPSAVDAATHVSALETIVDQLRLHLREHQIARLKEIRAHPDSETWTRDMIRNEESLTAHLSRITETINDLASDAESS
jgi:uncharacterized membrane protein YccC